MTHQAIITGFGQFGNYLFNPTERLMERLQGRNLEGYAIKSMTFPTQVDPGLGRILVKEAESMKAELILSLGMSSAVKGIRFELVGRNWVENAKYCSPIENRKPIIPLDRKKERLWIKKDDYDLEGFAKRLEKAGLELELSEDAGGWCCNCLIYTTLAYLKHLGLKTRFAFLHLPCVPECLPPGKQEDLLLITEEHYHFVVEAFLRSVYQGKQRRIS